MKIRTSLAGLLLVPCVSVCAADDMTPMARVKHTVDTVVSIVRGDTSDPESRWLGIRQVIEDSFDFRSISQSVLATDWHAATPAQREEFIKYFSRFLEETYRSKIEAYTNQTVMYQSETIQGDRAIVETTIVSGATKTPVYYKLHRNDDGRWYGYDVVIEGISLVNNYRTTFGDIVKKDGIAGLIEDLKRKLEQFERAILKAPVRVAS